MTQPRPYGIAAEFEDAGQLLNAARAAREAGFRRFEAYSPYPIRELDDVIPSWDMLSPIALVTALVGGVIGFYMQFFMEVDVYPLNIGGRPLNSWQAYTVITFELVVLFAIGAVFAGTLFFQGLPALYHPLFRIPTFKYVSSDAFMLCIEARDPRFDAAATTRFLNQLDPLKIWEVDRE